MDVLKDVRDLQPGAEVLVITGYGSVDSAVAVMKEGAYDYLTKPVEPKHWSIWFIRPSNINGSRTKSPFFETSS